MLFLLTVSLLFAMQFFGLYCTSVEFSVIQTQGSTVGDRLLIRLHQVIIVSLMVVETIMFYIFY